MFGRLGSVAASGRALTTTAIARALGAAGLTDAQARAAIGAAATLDDGLRTIGLLPKRSAAPVPAPTITGFPGGALPDAVAGQPYDATFTVDPAGTPVTIVARRGGVVVPLETYGLAHDGKGRLTSNGVVLA